jgi:hypothetical protein|tara:strand:- start:901 stop:1074 length:174 start_codon:yes stop_codon:yes gene_type:complete
MKIRIKTNLIEIEIQDEPKIGSDNYTKRVLPELPECIEKAISEAVKLHNEVSKKEKA